MADLGTLWFGSDIDLTTLKQKIQQGNKSILDALKMDYDPQSYQEMIGRLRTSLARETFEIKINANPQGLAQNLRQSLGSNKGLTGGLDELNEKILAQTEAVNRLKARLESLRATYANQKRAGQYLQLGNTGQQIADVRKELALEKATLSDFITQRNTLRNATKDTLLNLRREAVEHRNTSTAARESIRQRREAIRQLNSDHVRLNSTILGGIHVSTQFGSALSSLFAVHAARQFLNNVIDIGGQLEKQRISMQAILGDTSRANQLFEQIKGLAVKSPFGVVELDQYSKQLAAFGIEQSNLFDMTKRLADISAGAGQDIGRLALALGHVKSATYLTGITLRQFSMNNIPMLKMLADYYTEVEHRAVSTAEVQKRISKRQVSYEDVVTQIKRMTDAGGQFYNMQEKISESLSAKFKNLQDSFDIMYGEIAESAVGDMLKTFASGATELSRNWKQVLTIIAEVVLQFGAYKSAVIATNWATMNLNKSTIATALSQGKLSASMIKRYVTTGQITNAQLLQAVATKKVSVAEAELAAATFGVTKAQLEHIAATGRYVGLLDATSLATSRFTVAQLRLIATLRAGNLSGFAKIWNAIGLGISYAGTQMKKFGSAIAPLMKQVAVFAAISTVIDIFLSKTHEEEEQQQRLADMTEKANEGYKHMTEARRKFAVGASKGMNDDAISLSITEMVEHLQNYSQTAKETFNNAFQVDSEGKAVHSLAEQYEILAKGIETTEKAYREFDKIKAMVEASVDAATPELGFLDTAAKYTIAKILPKSEKLDFLDLKESVEYYAESLHDASLAEQNFLRNRLEITRLMEDMGVVDAASMTNDQILEKLTEWMVAYPSKYKEFSEKLDGDVEETFGKMNAQWDKLGRASDTATDRLKKSGESLFESLKGYYGTDDISKWGEEWREIVLNAMHSSIDGINGFKNLSKEAQLEIYNTWLTPFKIKLDSSDAQSQVNNLLVELQNLVGKEWVVQIGVKGVSSIEDVKNATDSYSKAVKDVEDTTRRLSKLEKEGKKNTEQYTKTLTDQQDAIARRDAAASIIHSYGGDLPETKKKPTGGTGRKADEAAKEMRQQIKLIKDAYSWYKKYKDELKWSPRDAFAEIGAKYGDVLKKLGVDWDAEKGDITSYSKSLQNLLEKAEALYATPAHKNSYMLDVIKELKDALQQTDFDEMKESMQHFASEMELTLKNLSRQWELYKSIRDATGSRELAAQLSGTGGLFNNMAESLESIITDLSEGMAIDFGSVVNMDDKAIKDYVASLGLSKEKTDGIINALEQWRDLQRNLLNESITSYAKMLTDADSLKKKLVEINSNYKDQIVQLKTLRKNGYIDEDEYNNRASQADRTRKLNLAEAFVGGFDWSRVSQIYGNILTGAAEQLKRKLDELISSEDFKQMSITEQRKYLDLQSKLRKNDGSVMSPFNISEWRNATEHLKNFQGATQRLIEATSDYEQAIRDEKEATKALTEAKTDEGCATAQAALNAAKERKNAASGNMSQAQSDMQQEGQEFLDAESKAAQGLSNFASAIQTISSGKLSDFVMGIDAIINTIAGKEKSASLSEAVTGILEGVGVKSGNIYGMIIAAILELIDAIGDDAGGFVGGIVDKIFDLITGLIDDIFSGDLVEKIAKSIFEGIGSLISSIVKNIGTLPVGIFNIVKGAVGGIFGGLFEGLGFWDSDEDLQEEIEASQRQVEVLERIHDLLEKKLEYVLGGVYNFSNPENTRQFSAKTNGYKEYFENQLKWAKKAQDGSRTAFNWYAAMPADMLKESVDYLTKAVEAFNRANKTGEYYDQQRALLFAQRRELETQLANEQDKKDSDSAAIENYRNQIEDLDFQIKNFAMDMAKALYDIDLQSWASELTDAVVSAWENGENAAEAYTNKVKDLMKDLTKNVLAKKVMEQAFENAGLDDLIVRLMDESSGKLDYSAIPEIAKALGKAGADSTDVITRVLDEMERLGYIDKGGGESSSGSITSGIKSITENTADLLASYINAIRADVSVNRVSISVNLPLIASAVQRSSVLAETQVALQTQIVQNTQRSAEAAEAIQNILRLATIDRSHAIFMQ